MTNLTDVVINADDESAGSGRRQSLWIMLYGVGLLMTAGAITGLLSAADAKNGGTFDTAVVVVLLLLIAVAGALAYAIWRSSRKLKQNGEKLTHREKRNNQVILGCGLLGGLIALILVQAGEIDSHSNAVFSNGPIQPAIAIGLALAIGVIVPALSWYWHQRVIDEQEADAYKSGALLALYAYWIVAPLWWVLWRGGLLSPPDGIALYMMTTFTVLIIWMWKKYR
ncbi:MAG: hypothetical protein WBO17_14630 [Sphingorhabdus sp.]